MKIVICGSMSASKEMIEARNKLKEAGHYVTLPDFTEEYAEMDTLDKMHTESARNKVEYDLIKGYYNKIKESEAVFVVNPERKGILGYIGGNAFLEMGFAFVLDKDIFLLNEIPEVGYKDEIEAMMPKVINGDYSLVNIS